jgi:metal-responsive CopG/Arc/MetJ family transcriptional regulator
VRLIVQALGFDNRSYWKWNRKMPSTKVAITFDSGLLDKLDKLVAQRVFPSRSAAIQKAVPDKLDRVEAAGWRGSAQS